MKDKTVQNWDIFLWCEANAITLEHFGSVEILFNLLTDSEATSQHCAITGGFDPRNVDGFKTIEDLWQKNGDKAPTMRSDEQKIFEVLINRRFFTRPHI